jgi:hypothetical protein
MLDFTIEKRRILSNDSPGFGQIAGLVLETITRGLQVPHLHRNLNEKGHLKGCLFIVR